MIKRFTFQIFAGVLTICSTLQVVAVTAVGTVDVDIVRFLTLVNTSGLEFGKVSVSGAAGTVEITPDGSRYATGGAAVDPADHFSPATFVIQGRPNESFAVQLPDSLDIFDNNGNKIVVGNFSSNSQQGSLGPSGDMEIMIGGKLNLDPNQPTGSYSGTLVIDVHYS